MDYLQKIITAFELHDTTEIALCFKHGIDPNQLYRGRPLIDELINMYTRGPAFKNCVRVFVEHGLVFEDPMLLAVLMDDAETLETYLQQDKTVMTKRYSFACAFTPLYQVSLLHICAEYNHTRCAATLLAYGADPDVEAGTDEYGFGGHTPVFHTVNQHQNKSMEMLQLLVDHGADLAFTVKGLIWGKGYEWETFIPAVNPVSYAMMGLLRQFQRTEKDIYMIVQLLLKAGWGIQYEHRNIPNKYLQG